MLLVLQGGVQLYICIYGFFPFQDPAQKSGQKAGQTSRQEPGRRPKLISDCVVHSVEHERHNETRATSGLGGARVLEKGPVSLRRAIHTVFLQLFTVSYI